MHDLWESPRPHVYNWHVFPTFYLTWVLVNTYILYELELTIWRLLGSKVQ